MNVVIINGSPRKNGNTAQMCRAFAEGVKSQVTDANIETFNLYDYEFKGCQSCFACKLDGASTYGKCVVNDSIKPILGKAVNADILVLASPVYLMDITGEYKSFLERLLFPLASYEEGYRSLATNKIHVATIYTMNISKEMCPDKILANSEYFIGHVFSSPRRICAYNTYQFNDYSKYRADVFNEKLKRQYRTEIFPTELKEAYTSGADMTLEASRKS